MIDAIFISVSYVWIRFSYRLACACTFSGVGARRACESTSGVVNFWVPSSSNVYICDAHESKDGTQIRCDAEYENRGKAGPWLGLPAAGRLGMILLFRAQ